MSVIQLGQPVLRKVSTPAIVEDTKTAKIIDSLKKELKAAGGVGIAAPQVGVNKQIMFIKFGPTPRRPEITKNVEQVYINPIIIDSADETETLHEGCLSFLSIRGEVARPQWVVVNYHDENGNHHENVRLTGFHARVFQHEYDHLQGLVYLDKLLTSKTVMTESEYETAKAAGRVK